MFESMPIFDVCGYSGSGKTTLLEQVVPRFLRRGLRVVVVKHDVHGVTPDGNRKDSDRLFHAGADVVVHGPGESLGRYCHREDLTLWGQLEQLTEHYDLVLLEGFKQLPCRKVWLLRDGEPAPPEGIGPFDAVLSWDARRAAMLEKLLTGFLDEVAGCSRIFGCVLIGGGSTRMGKPKHLLPCAEDSRETWLHNTVRVLQQTCEQVVLAGRGTVPEDLQGLPTIADPPDFGGPMAGLLAAMRWAPRAGWMLAACDLPCLSEKAVRWILAQRAAGVWAVLPRVANSSRVEPLLAWYDFRCRPVLESMALSDRHALQEISQHLKARVVTVPAALADAWSDADTPQAAAPFIDASLGAS